MSVTFTVPTEFPLVLFAGAAAGLLIEWQRFVVTGRARKRANIPYPLTFAPDTDKRPEAIAFNCAQRANMNTLEALPAFYFSLIFTGLKHPRFAAIFGGMFVIGRIFYTLGYVTGDPSKRYRGLGGVAHVGSQGLVLAALWTSGKMVYEFFTK